MANDDALLIKNETTIGTFVTPDTAIPVKTVEVDASETRIEERYTGLGRDLYELSRGAHRPMGTIALAGHPGTIGKFLNSLFFGGLTTSTPGGGTSSRDHVFIPNDGSALKGISMQLQRSRNGTTVTHNIRGGLITEVTFSIEVDQYLQVEAKYAGIEMLIAGGTFADSTSSVAAQTVTYGTYVRRFQFDDLTVEYGGTNSKDGTTKVYTMSGGTAVSNLESLSVTIGHEVEHRVALGSRYPQSHHVGIRNVKAEMTFQENAPSDTFYAKYIANSTDAWHFKFSGPTIESTLKYELDIYLPAAYYEEAAYGGLNASYEARTIDVALRAGADATTDDAVAVRLRDIQTSY